MNFKLISSEFEIYAFQLRFRSKYYKKKIILYFEVEVNGAA